MLRIFARLGHASCLLWIKEDEALQVTEHDGSTNLKQSTFCNTDSLTPMETPYEFSIRSWYAEACLLINDWNNSTLFNVRWYTKYFGYHGNAGSTLVSHALRMYPEWETKIEEWQQPILRDKYVILSYTSCSYNYKYSMLLELEIIDVIFFEVENLKIAAKI